MFRTHQRRATITVIVLAAGLLTAPAVDAGMATDETHDGGRDRTMICRLLAEPDCDGTSDTPNDGGRERAMTCKLLAKPVCEGTSSQTVDVGGRDRITICKLLAEPDCGDQPR